MTTMIPVMREAARVAQVPQALHVARTAPPPPPPPPPPPLTAEAAAPVKYFDMLIFHPTSEKTLDELLNAEIDL
jgi:hypothetical protein